MRVALVGANGHGRHHRERVPDLAALCDPADIQDPPPGVPLFRDHQKMLDAIKPDVVIVCTPPATHLPISADALRAGADVLLEKPPVLSLAEHDELSGVEKVTRRSVQVGFQALGSPQLPELRREAPCDVSVVSSWQRDDTYWTRSSWAGRLPLDGALRNPFAHAIMQALSINDSPPVLAEVAWGRTREQLEVDDTATLRLSLANGCRILIAVSLAGDEFVDGWLRAGSFQGNFRHDNGTSLLDNLIAHRRVGEPLLAPLSHTRAFTAVVQALSIMPRPGLLAAQRSGQHQVLPGIAALLRDCGGEFALLSEISNPWAATVTGGSATIG